LARPRGTSLKFGWNRSGVNLIGKPAISLKRGKIGPRLLLMTYRKSHTRFRCKFSLDLRMPAPIYTGMVCRTRCQSHVAFVDDSCQSTELFLELTLVRDVIAVDARTDATLSVKKVTH